MSKLKLFFIGSGLFCVGILFGTLLDDLSLAEAATNYWAFLNRNIYNTNANNVGVGTSSPQAKLHVAGATYSANSDQDVLIGDDVALPTGKNRTKIVFGQSDADTEVILAQDATHGILFKWDYNATATNAVGVFETYGGNNPLVLQSVGGNVGIGTTSPNEKLTLEGILSLHEESAPSATSNYGKLYVKSSDSKLYFKNDTGGETDLTAGGSGYWSQTGGDIYYNGGSVGIGTGTPSTELHVVGDATVNGTVTANAFSGDGSGLSGVVTSESDPQVGANTTSYVPRWNGSALVTGTIYDNGSSVGIGTGSPSGSLQITGDEVRIGDSGTIGYATDDGDLYIEDALEVDGTIYGTGITSSGNIDLSSLSAGGIVKAAASTGRLSIATGGTDYENPLTFTNGLTRSSNTVKLGASLSESTTITQAGFDMIFNLSTTGDFRVQDDGSDVLFVKDDGKVGVGTTNPSEELDVDGNVKVGGVVKGNTSGNLIIRLGN